MTSIRTLHDQARRAVAAGEAKLRDAAELLAKAAELGATQRQSAKAIGKSQRWVNALLQWRKNGYKGAPFEKPKRAQRDTPAIRKRTPEQVARQHLIKALNLLASNSAAERASAALIVETTRGRLNLAWSELIVPAADEMTEAA